MPSDDAAPAPKEVKLQIRLDAELADRVAAKARRYGGASAVVRALLRRWVEQDIVTVDDVLAEVNRAQQRRPRRKRRK
jgi:Arc/MetJ-type ribon-helix-helix transcriptional regulator